MVTFASHSLPTDLTDLAVSADDMPWVSNGQGLAFKPLHYSPSTGMWINLIRCERKGRISRHLHTGGSVHGYVLQGSWRYVEHEWVATAGTYVWEPPGDVHTLEVLGDEDMVTLFVVHGVIQYLDDEDRLVQQDDMRSRQRMYLDHCAANGIEPRAIFG
jgi:2,4'-dihydroxyacetophenone dioxygenase